MHRIFRVSKLLLIMIAVMLVFMSFTFINAGAENDPLTIVIIISDKDYDGNPILIDINDDIEFYDELGDVAVIDINDVVISYYDINDLINPLVAAPADAGSYRVVVTYNDVDSSHAFAPATESADFVIFSISVSFVVSATTTYGNAPEWQYGALIGGSFVLDDDYDDLGIDFTSINMLKNAGVHTPTTTNISNSNYNAIIFWNYVINSKDIVVTIQSINITYGDSFAPSATINPTSLPLPYGDSLSDLNLTYKVNGTDLDDSDLSVYGAGSYNLSAAKNNNNYNIIYTNGTLNISKYIANIEVSGTCVYGTNVSMSRIVSEQESIFTYELKNSLSYNDDYDSLGVKYYVDNVKPVVGSNHIIRSSVSNSNYIISLVEATLIVTPRYLEAKINDLTIIYGNTPSFSLTILNGTYADGDNVNTLRLNYSGHDKYVTNEPYEVTAVALSTDYYLTLTEGLLTVNPRTINIYVQDIIITYGDNKYFPYSLPSGEILPHSDSLAMLGITVSSPQINAGAYQATMSYNNPNYNIIFHGGQYTINKKSIEIKINDLSIVYGETPQYSGVLWNSALVAPDTMSDLNIIYSSESLNYGERYTLSGSYSNPNYNVTFREGRIEIAKRPITIIVDNVTVSYGESPVFTYRLAAGSVLAIGDNLASLNVVCSSSGVNVIEAPVDISRSYNNPNYLITFVDGKHLIEPRDITIKVKNVTKQFGQDRELTVNDIEVISGAMALGEPLSGLNIAFVTSGIGNIVGEYPLTVTASNSNYNITIEDGVYKINKRRVTLTVEDIVKAYGDKDKTIEYTSSVSGVTFSGKLSREPGEKEGTYEILIGTLSAGDNYDLILSPATLTIEKSMPPVAFVGIGFLGLSFLGSIFLIIRKLMGATLI